MGLPGQLAKDKFGYPIPVNAPMYKAFPVYYDDAEVLSVTYLTDFDLLESLPGARAG